MGHALALEGRRAGQRPDVFSHIKDLQFEAKPDGPDAAFARRLQEALGGRWGELTVANLLADFHVNVTAEAQGLLQLSRLFPMTDDPGVKQMLRFLLARDTAGTQPIFRTRRRRHRKQRRPSCRRANPDFTAPRRNVMPVALTARTLIVGAYLLALAFNGRFDTAAGLIAVAVVGVWVISLLRDRRLCLLRTVTPVNAQGQINDVAAGGGSDANQA
jgi:hypothetical protein